jgi:O-antigen/teichoic acid export membrane protein
MNKSGSSKHLVLKGISLITFGNVFGQILRFVRNVLIARILTPEDFGVAATFWITTGFLMSLSELGVEKMIVQDKSGDDEYFGSVAQLVLMLRGIGIAAIIFMFAEPFAFLFKTPEASWAFRLLAVIPFIRSFQHRDIIRLQRHMSFGPFVLSRLIADVAITILAWPIAKWTENYTAFLYISILHVMVGVVASHVIAKRRFIVKWDYQIFRRIFVFGWPLLLNAILMFTMFQGDRIILANAYTKTELGVYSIALSIAMLMPTLIGGILSQVLLPYLSKFQNDKIQLENKLSYIAMVVALISTLIAASTIIAGPAFISIIYTKKYILAGTVIGWLGVMHSIRLLRQIPILVSIALGDTINALVANIFRQSGLLFALVVALSGGSISQIAISGVFGELVALGTAFFMTKKRLNIALILWIKPVSFFSSVVLLTLIVKQVLMTNNHLTFTVIELIIAIIAILTFCLALDKKLRSSLIETIEIIFQRLRVT